MWIPQPWKVAYSKVPEGLKLTIDTDEWFDKENPLGRFIDFILDIYNSDYDSSVRELTGIDIYSDVEFLSGEKSGYATYLIKNNTSNNLKESRTYFGDEIKEVVDWLIESPYNNWQEKDRKYLMSCDNEKLFKYESDTFDLECAERSLYESNNYGDKNMKFKEGPSPKWKQKILDDINEILDIVYSVINDENGEWKEPEKYLSFSVNKFIELIKTLIDAEKYSENLLKYVAIDLWIDLHCDDSVGDFNDGPEPKLKYAKYLNLRKELWNLLCDEYQTKYGRKRNPQPYIKNPMDASEIFDKFHQLRYESNELTKDFKKIYNENKEVKYMDFKKIYEMARTVKNGTIIDHKNWIDDWGKEYAKNSLIRVLKSKGVDNIEVASSDSHRPCAVSAFLGKFTFVYLYLLDDKYVLQVKDTQKVVEEWKGSSFDQLKRDIFEFEADFEDFAPTLN